MAINPAVNIELVKIGTGPAIAAAPALDETDPVFVVTAALALSLVVLVMTLVIDSCFFEDDEDEADDEVFGAIVDEVKVELMVEL